MKSSALMYSCSNESPAQKWVNSVPILLLRDKLHLLLLKMLNYVSDRVIELVNV